MTRRKVSQYIFSKHIQYQNKVLGQRILVQIGSSLYASTSESAESWIKSKEISEATTSWTNLMFSFLFSEEASNHTSRTDQCTQDILSFQRKRWIFQVLNSWIRSTKWNYNHITLMKDKSSSSNHIKPSAPPEGSEFSRLQQSRRTRSR